MARIQNPEQALVDTVSLCQQIKTAAHGLTDREIEIALFANEIDATGRRFNRWLKGQNAMTPDMLQLLTQKALSKGWIKAPRPSGIGTPRDQRVVFFLSDSERASETIAKHNHAVLKLHKAKVHAEKALANLCRAAKGVEKNLVFVNCQAGYDEDPEFCFTEVDRLAKKLDQLGFLDVSPWVSSCA